VKFVVGEQRVLLADCMADLAVALLRVSEKLQSALRRFRQRRLVMPIKEAVKIRATAKAPSLERGNRLSQPGQS